MGANIASFSHGTSNFNFGRGTRQSKAESRLDALLAKNVQHPRSLEEIMKCTRFSKAEIRLLYRSFKEECPGGNVTEERLREIYLQFFPQGSKAP
ncbi:unnamed protein product [Rotaria socialis]|uniref:Uncharacterized protein n=1 Tax=Rotaria socialis TaxID=392032 RepID=A0A821SDK6_9BILA|nr:unnamed protein product [Rotaria socialis]